MLHGLPPLSSRLDGRPPPATILISAAEFDHRAYEIYGLPLPSREANMNEDQDVAGTSEIELATELTIAWLRNPNVQVSAEDVPAFLRKIHVAISELSRGPIGLAEAVHTPAVPVRSSIKPDYIVSLIDGRKFKSLKRHLSGHGLTPAEYRERYGLKADYPMVAATYSARRREVAQKLGLGRKRAVPAAPAPAPAPEPAVSTPAAEIAKVIGNAPRKAAVQRKPKLTLKLG